jgi:hypothetical protein
MTAPRARRFCQALLEETRGEILRWASIDSVTERLGIERHHSSALFIPYL